MADIKEIVRKNVRELRKAKGLSQVELAKKSGLTVRYLNRVENQPQNVSIEQLARLAEGLGVSACALIATKAEADAAMLEQILGPLDRAIGELDALRGILQSDRPLQT